MFKKSLICGSIISSILSANATFNYKSSYLEEEKFGSNGTKMSFSMPQRYEPKKKEKLTYDDVIFLIHEGTFDFDDPNKKTYLTLLGDINDETTLYAYEELKAFYKKNNNNKLVNEIDEKINNK